MTERFFGRWTVEVTSRNAGYAQWLSIAGGSTADGLYDAAPGLRLDVDGPEWTLDMLWDDAAGSGLQPSDVRRRTTVELATGITVVLGVDDNWPAARDGDYDDVVLTCVYGDPAVNPPLTVPPLEFTIDERWLRPGDDDDEPDRDRRPSGPG